MVVELEPVVYEIGIPNTMYDVPWPTPVAVGVEVPASAASLVFSPLRTWAPEPMVRAALLVRFVVAEASGTAIAALANDCALASAAMLVAFVVVSAVLLLGR